MEVITDPSIRFLFPEWFWLIPVSLIVSCFFLANKIKTKHLSVSDPASMGVTNTGLKQSYYHPLTRLLPGDNKRSKNKLSSCIFMFIAVCLFTTSLAQPVRTGSKIAEPPRQRDIVFIVDTSVSMILRDYILNGQRIDRMSLLKGVLDNFVQNLKGERISIIVFGDTAYTLVPLTNDQLLLRNMIKRIQATMAGRFNAIGDAIALSVKQANENKQEKRNRILVLLTDADQPTGTISPITAARVAKQARLPLYTVAIGATDFSADEKRQDGLLYSPVDIELVNNLALITGAKSYHAKNLSALDNAIAEINKYQAHKGKVTPRYYQQQLFYWPLIVFVILYSFSQVVFIIRRSL